MDIETVIRESQAETLVGPLGFQSNIGKQQFLKQLRFFTANEEAIQRRQAGIENLRRTLTDESKGEIDQLFRKIAEIEPHCQIFFEKSDVEKNSYEQLTFSAWMPTQILNSFPFVLLLLSYFKLYLVPFLAVLTPVFMVLMPYIILVYFYHLPLTFYQYKDLMLGMMGIQSEHFWTPKNLMQVGITTFSVIQSMAQPVQNALHLQTINKDLVQKGQHVEELVYTMKALSKYIPMNHPFEESLSDPHRSFAESWDFPFRLQYALQLLGDAEVTYRMATAPVRRVILSKEEALSFLDAYDPLVPNSIPFTVNLQLQSNHHVILTGPNRGGKSSFLRGILLNVLLAQTFGYTYAKSCLLKPIHWIATGLKLEDRPGKTSMFEREVEFAVSILKRAKKSPKERGLLLFDELFHSTNPPDGTRTAKLFLQQVWKQANLYSIISTHVFDIAKKAPDSVLRLCIPAIQKETGELQFTYTVKEGICEVSSVDTILKEKGLFFSA
jgi:hypothetical protein